MNERDEFLRFLDRRIPELHAIGKSKPPAKETTPEQAARIRRNLAAATYPGVLAARQAKREWSSTRSRRRPVAAR